MKNIWIGLQVSVIALLIITVGAFMQNWVRNEFPPKEVSITPSPAALPYQGVVCPNDFNIYSKEEKQIAELISTPKSMFAQNGHFVNSQIVITKNETKDSQIACGYLSVKVHTKEGALKAWENLYINPNNFGGHIDKSNQFGLGDGNSASEYLFSLSDMKYWKNKNRGTILTADWAALLNVSDSVTFEIDLNTQDRSGVIDNMSIAYKCWDPTTGKENTICKLKVDKVSDTESSTLR